ncbi:MAG: 16S rRNA (guanine(527)-N(7))-methyltransferase RsmG [Nitriliruptoraceae bacterium]
MQPDDQLRALSLAVRSSPHNLVSRAAREQIDTRHIPESVAFATWLPPGIGTLLDIGSGGGFPGLVIAIMRPEITVHLVDSVAKKAQFLSDMTDTLGLNCVVHAQRIEVMARSLQAPHVDAMTARAVASLSDLAQMAAPLLRVGGFLYAIKGERWSDELDAARDTLKRVKLRVHAVPEDGVEPADGSLPRVVTLQKV